jgi:LmbE family N-acetylglucosaminyl deacetylase
LDSQYRSPNTLSPPAVAEALEHALETLPSRVVILPLGLFHHDHELVHEAGLLLLRRDRQRHWMFYADAIYRGIAGLLEERLRRLRASSLSLLPMAVPLDPVASARKRQAVDCYGSQLRALTSPGRPGLLDILEPEQYWDVEVSDHGVNG